MSFNRREFEDLSPPPDQAAPCCASASRFFLHGYDLAFPWKADGGDCFDQCHVPRGFPNLLGAKSFSFVKGRRRSQSVDYYFWKGFKPPTRYMFAQPLSFPFNVLHLLKKKAPPLQITGFLICSDKFLVYVFLARPAVATRYQASALLPLMLQAATWRRVSRAK